MSEVLNKIDDKKFATILSEDFTACEDKDAFMNLQFPGSQYQRTPFSEKPGYGGGSDKPISDEALVRAFAKLLGEDPAKAQQTYQMLMQPAATPAPTGVGVPRMEEASEDKDAFIMPGMQGPRSTRDIMDERQQRYENQKGLSNKPISDEALARAFEKLVAEMSPQKKQKAQKLLIQPSQTPDFSKVKNVKPIPGLTREEEMAAEASDSTVGMFWTKDASDAILNNLVRDVVGMDKSICCDTGRKLEKNQVPDGTHDGDKAKTLKPEQIPDQKDVLDSGIVEKSHGKVRKEAGALEEMKEQKAEKAEEKSEKLEEKAKEHAEQAAKTLDKAKEQEAKAEKSEQEAEKSEKAEDDKDDKQANIVDGIELGPVMEDVTLDAAEAQKLSNLFA
jgi:hypothetical protein